MINKSNNIKRVISVVGARPNFMKAAPIYMAFQKYSSSVENIIVHTGQHYDRQMSDKFFEDLEMPHPAAFLGVGSGTHAEQTAKIMVEFEKACLKMNPDLVIVVGDVNSTMAAAITAAKLSIKLAHVEAGLRSFDRSMPEEINRIVTDSIADCCFATEQSGVDNLLREGFPAENIFLVGNTMIDSLQFALESAKKSDILEKLGLMPKEFVLVTLHRPSNVDNESSLRAILDIFRHISCRRKIVFPIHPRTRKNLQQFDLEAEAESIAGLRLVEPLGYISFLALLLSSDFVLTDSGGIQEETTTVGIHCLTMRTSTERPVTCQLGTNILVKPELNDLVRAIDAMFDLPRKKGLVPPLWDGKASERITKIITEKFL